MLICRFVVGSITVSAADFSSKTGTFRRTSSSSRSLKSASTSTNIIFGFSVEDLVGLSDLGLVPSVVPCVVLRFIPRVVSRVVLRVVPRVVSRVVLRVVPRVLIDIFLLVVGVGAEDSVAPIVFNVGLLCSIEAVEIFLHILSFKNGTLDRYINTSLSPGVASPFLARSIIFCKTFFKKLAAEGRFPNRIQYRQ